MLLTLLAHPSWLAVMQICFPSNATVQRYDPAAGTFATATMEQLAIGDQVACLKPTDSGETRAWWWRLLISLHIIIGIISCVSLGAVNLAAIDTKHYFRVVAAVPFRISQATVLHNSMFI